MFLINVFVIFGSNNEPEFPIIYSAAPYYKALSQRWQNQFHENSKSMAFANSIPEMNHNEIVGWEQDSNFLNEFIVIFLEDENPDRKIENRIKLTKKIIKNRGIQVVEIYSKGSSLIEKVFSLIVLGDWISYYLALAYKVDPIEIKNVDKLKMELANIN